ncbi:L-histidine N(alpha)-methyltransferase [Candidatus Uhrbacteria bacterium]|nr:L-histidine N(alpha)-methyltransferase [Candidatus Uhrbacteria bacterium]
MRMEEAERTSLREFTEDIRIGLSATPKKIPSKYFYDARGDKIFEKITHLPTYYVTRSETEILRRNAKKILEPFADGGCNLVELGPGDGQKTRIFLNELVRLRTIPLTYTPIDISRSVVRKVSASLLREFSQIDIRGLAADFSAGLHALKNDRQRKLVLFLGSSIGNMNGRETLSFLKKLRATLRTGDRVLIGFDLKKEIGLLERAYDDPEGVTREFNFNLLRRINRELGGSFNVSHFRHHACYNPILGAMESYVVSAKVQRVRIRALKQTFSFDAWEPIHTEYSFKYSEAQIYSLSRSVGFKTVARFTDRRGYFLSALWEV